jgi:hypothetical protein
MVIGIFLEFSFSQHSNEKTFIEFFFNKYIFFIFFQQIFNKQLIWDKYIYIFFKMPIFYVILNKYKGPHNKKNNNLSNKNDF